MYVEFANSTHIEMRANEQYEAGVVYAIYAFFKYYFDKFQVVNFKHDLLLHFLAPGAVLIKLAPGVS